MKLVTFHHSGRGNRVGAVTMDGSIVDLNAAYALYLRDVEREGTSYALADARVPADMRGLFENGDRGLDAARAALEYALKRGPAWIVFFQNVDAIIGPDEEIVYPEHLTEELDYELELAVVLKKAGKHFSAEQAGEYIGGYVIFNDITARDIQRTEMKSGVFSFCKGIDTFCPLGPHIVTADEIPNANNLAMELRVNGKARQQSHSSKMSVTVPEIIAHYSPMGYSAGDVLSTGTVSGVAAFSGDPKSLYLKPGDVVECEIEKIGVLRNPVVSYKEKHGGKSVAAA